MVPPQFDTFTTQFLHLRLGEGRSGDIKTESQRTITLVAKHYLLKMIIIKKRTKERKVGRGGSGDMVGVKVIKICCTKLSKN